MAEFVFEGKTYHTYSDLPKVGDKAPDFTLTKTDLGEIRLQDFTGTNLIMNILPGIDTETCAASVRTFNLLTRKCHDFEIYNVSIDLPFTQKRFCTSEKLDDVHCASVFRHPEFGENYGITIIDGPFKGLLARSIVAIDTDGNVIYTQFVKDIISEPDYDELIKSLNK